jgi:hypothetical protein
MAKEELLELDDIVDEVLPDSCCRGTLDNGLVVGSYASAVSGRITSASLQAIGSR